MAIYRPKVLLSAEEVDDIRKFHKKYEGRRRLAPVAKAVEWFVNYYVTNGIIGMADELRRDDD
jgi:hypothetical protein